MDEARGMKNRIFEAARRFLRAVLLLAFGLFAAAVVLQYLAMIVFAAAMVLQGDWVR